MNMLSDIAFILSFTILVAVATYPVQVFLRSIFCRNFVQKSDEYSEPVSILMCCYNEAEFVANRIQFFLDEQEWIPGSELIIVSGGSDDGTSEIIKEFESDSRVTCFLFNERKTKIDGLNFAVPKCRNELLIFSDCRQKIEPNSVIELIRNFNDPRIGTVTSTLIDSKDDHKPSLIRKILRSTAQNESTSGSCLNVYGALYGQRKSTFRPFPQNILFEDLFVVVSTICQGKRVIQESKAIIYDLNFDHYYQPERIRRLARGLLIFMRYHFSIIFSLPFPILLRFLVFKYFKLLIPFAVLTIGIQLLPLIQSSSHFILILLILMGIAFIKPIRKTVIKALQFNYHFLASIVNFTTGKNQSFQWEKLKIKTETR